ncbi:MAG: glycerol-3-phosphate 1-O-acyltransferase PlsY [Gammaproteobacteria bacterium]|nr:glycerol-3-phosphate 1-O-acyltransferase PlsY [Gammaproteobacteria bacterium]
MITLATQDYLWLLLGYLMGSVSSAIIVCRVAGLPDPRTQGSGNPGATNVLRVGGKKYAAITLAGDSLKSVIPVLLAKLMGADLDLQITIGLACFLGHLYPVFFSFRGGKGVATAMGAIIVASWPVGLGTILTWLFVAKVLRISSLSALIAFFLTPVYAWVLEPSQTYFLTIIIIMSVLLFWRHRSNIRNLISGTED